MARRDNAEKEANDPYIWKAPELVVECLSPSNRKGSLDELLRDYRQVGVPDIWFAQPELHSMRQYTVKAGKLREAHWSGNQIVTASRPPLRVDLGELWQTFDRGLGA